MAISNCRGRTSEAENVPASVVPVPGEVDVASALGVERELERARGPEPREIVIDLEGLTFMDSTGGRLLVPTLRHATGYGYDVRLRGLPAQARRVLETAGALHRFDSSD